MRQADTLRGSHLRSPDGEERIRQCAMHSAHFDMMRKNEQSVLYETISQSFSSLYCLVNSSASYNDCALTFYLE